MRIYGRPSSPPRQSLGFFRAAIGPFSRSEAAFPWRDVEHRRLATRFFGQPDVDESLNQSEKTLPVFIQSWSEQVRVILAGGVSAVDHGSVLKLMERVAVLVGPLAVVLKVFVGRLEVQVGI